MLIGALPQDAAKYDGDHSAPLEYRPLISGRSALIKRDDTPLRLLTSFEIDTCGGYSTSRCT
jgi:hypothetical protein